MIRLPFDRKGLQSPLFPSEIRKDKNQPTFFGVGYAWGSRVFDPLDLKLSSLVYWLGSHQVLLLAS